MLRSAPIPNWKVLAAKLRIIHQGQDFDSWWVISCLLTGMIGLLTGLAEKSDMSLIITMLERSILRITHLQVKFTCHCLTFILSTDYGHPERAFFQRFETFGLGQTNWAEIFWDIGVFSAKLQALFWHFESLLHGKMYLVLFPTKKFSENSSKKPNLAFYQKMTCLSSLKTKLYWTRKVFNHLLDRWWC